jgi:hypothetical protein
MSECELLEDVHKDELDTLDVDHDVVWVLGKDEMEAGCLCVACAWIKCDCFHRDNKMVAFALNIWMSLSEARIASTLFKVM